MGGGDIFGEVVGVEGAGDDGVDVGVGEGVAEHEGGGAFAFLAEVVEAGPLIGSPSIGTCEADPGFAFADAAAYDGSDSGLRTC